MSLSNLKDGIIILESDQSGKLMKIRPKVHFHNIISVFCLILIAICLPSKIGICPSYAYIAEGDFYDIRFEPGGKLNAERIDLNLRSFFAYLDKQEYTKRYEFAQGSNDKFNQIVELLLQNSPVEVRELDSISSVVKNCFYFFGFWAKNGYCLLRTFWKTSLTLLSL